MRYQEKNLELQYVMWLKQSANFVAYCDYVTPQMSMSLGSKTKKLVEFISLWLIHVSPQSKCKLYVHPTIMLIMIGQTGIT